jgi:uncharacterized membrane protein YgdD (TMEM256/DUF423 family)
MQGRIWLLVAAIAGGSGVGLGAFHAHGLERWLRQRVADEAVIAKRLQYCETASRYQLAHAPALLGLGIWQRRTRGSMKSAAGILFVTGMLGFCGGLYLGTFSGQLGHWAIVPSGGLCLMLGWLVLGMAALQSDPFQKQPATG